MANFLKTSPCETLRDLETSGDRVTGRVARLPPASSSWRSSRLGSPRLLSSASPPGDSSSPWMCGGSEGNIPSFGRYPVRENKQYKTLKAKHQVSCTLRRRPSALDPARSRRPPNAGSPDPNASVVASVSSASPPVRSVASWGHRHVEHGGDVAPGPVSVL